jgi:hypothetical protein
LLGLQKREREEAVVFDYRFVDTLAHRGASRLEARTPSGGLGDEVCRAGI